MAGLNDKDLMFDPSNLPTTLTKELIEEAHAALVRNHGGPWVDYRPMTLEEAHRLLRNNRRKK